MGTVWVQLANHGTGLSVSMGLHFGTKLGSQLEATEQEPTPITPYRGHLETWGCHSPANEVPLLQLISWEGSGGK